MARTKSENKNAVAKVEDVNTSLALPDYITGKEPMGLEALSSEDFNIPQLRLLHPINPEVQQYQGSAIPGEYWHTALMKSLGSKIPVVIAVARKRTIVWRPRNDQGGGILAVSNDSVNWDRGGNQEFTIQLKGVKNPVKWSTGANVKSSGLTNFGSSNPDDEQSAPAAVQYYEYIAYLPSSEHSGASPVVMRFHKTGLKTARDMNAYFLLQRQRGIPIYACKLELFIGTRPNPEGGEVFVPRFKPDGFVEKSVFEKTQQMHKDYANIELNIEQDSEADVVKNSDVDY